MPDRLDVPTVTLFGAFSWRLPPRGEPLRVAGDRPVALLAYLLLHRDAPTPRAHLAALLWPDTSDGQARTNLRNVLFTLRRSLPDADRYLDVDAATLRWRADVPLDLDVARFDEALAAAAHATDPAERARHLEAAAARYRGDLLEGRYDPWLEALRDAYRARWCDALRDLSAAHAERGDADAARRAAERRARIDPLDEPAAIDLIRRCAALGDRAAARRAFEVHAEALQRDLDADPSPAARAALTAALATPAAAPGLEPPAPPPRPLPTPGTPFVGRERERALVAERLDDPACRLLTIVGPGGFGKTRLALAVAADRAAREPEAVAWVGLASARTSAHAVAAIAASLRLRLHGATEAGAELARALAPRRVLLVLDDVEHVADMAPLCSELLAGAGGVTLLITSRRALGVPEEWRFEVDALPVPDVDGPDLAANDGVRLFLQAARRVAGPRAPTTADLTHVARICRGVGGVPLALELAASWTRLLTAAEIAVEVARGLDFLEGGTGGDRHRSLRGVFDRSWALLGDEERAVLARLAVFESGFTREAAARVANADLTRLAALVDRSLVQRASAARYQLHPLVRQYAAERLGADRAVADATAERHAAFVLEWLADQAPSLTGVRQPEALAAIAVEVADVRAAWAWAIAHGRCDLLDGAAFALFYAHEVEGALAASDEAFAAVARAFASAADPATHRTVAVAQAFGGFAALRLGRLPDAESRLEDAVGALAEDDPVRAHAERHLGVLRWAQGSFATATEHMAASRAGFVRARDGWGTTLAEAYLGMIAVDHGDLAHAPDRLEAVLVEARALGDPRLLANARLILGRARLLLDQPADAEALLRACLAEAQDPNSVGYATLHLGLARAVQGDAAEARTLLDRAAARFGRAEDAVGRDRAVLALGLLDVDDGDVAAARVRLRALLAADGRHHGIRYVLSVVVGAAALRARAGDPATARAWSDAVLRHPGLDVESRQRAQRLRATLPGPADVVPFEAVLAAVRRDLDA